MTSRERVLASLNHTQPDRMAVDFGGTNVTTIHSGMIEQLRDYYGLPKKPVTVIEPYTMVGVVDEDLREKLGGDCAMALMRGTAFGYPRDKTKIWTTPDGRQVEVPEQFYVKEDGRGGLYTYPQGDTDAPPCAHMPKGGFYFDAVFRGEKVDPQNMNPEDNLEEHGLLSDEDIAFFKAQVDAQYATGKAVTAALPGLALGDIAEIPGCSLKNPRGIRTPEEWYVASIRWPDYVDELFTKQMEIGLQNLQRIWDAVGDKVQVVFTCGTDHAHQKGLFLSPKTFKKLYLPHYQKINNWIHENTSWKTFKHNCGAVEPLIPLLIEAGFDILNPVQCSAKGMDPRHLKDTYGKDITFWGGGVDTQHTLPFGTPAEVRAEVLERGEIFSKDGGFVFNTIHVLQPGVPVENVVAMVDAIKEFNGER